MDKLYIIIPAINEAENIESVVRDWHYVLERLNLSDSCLVVLESGSKDNTLEILERLTSELPYLVVLTEHLNSHGAKVNFGYRYAIEQKADFIFQTDSDGQTLPEEFDAFWNARSVHTAIIGHRIHRKDGLNRVFVARVLKFLIFLIYGINVPDANTPFRLMESKKVEHYLRIMPKNYNLTNVMLTIMFIFYKDNIAFLPITFRPRQGGVNNTNFKKITKTGFNAIREFYEIKRKMLESVQNV